MGKFSFGSRKKPAPKVTVTGPAMSKAQKILGANALSIDSEFSGSKVSLAATERSAAAASYASSIRGSPRVHRLEREWGDESDIVPRHLRGPLPRDDEDYDEYDDIASDMVSALRKRQSASTLASWYDKSKQPLSISQQTSNSAMAKGMPSKAHKMLDMGNTQSNAKLKKKPAKLDLSHLMSRKSKKTTQQPQAPWEGPILNADEVVKSPSLLSPLPSPPRGKLNRRPTQESLRSEPARPGTKDSNRRVHNLEGLPNLYEHYEQMSFRQVIEQVKRPEDESKEKPKQPEVQPSKAHSLHSSKPTQHVHLPHHDEAIISQYAKRILPQTPQGSLINKAEASSPTDCAASVSSRHTRTSKASKRTDRSFQESDLQEKSVLSLSSDSEDDMYLESSFKGPASVPDYPTSDGSSAYDHRPTTSRTSSSADNKRFSKRSSLTPSSNFLTIPNGHHVKAPAVNARSSSLSASSANTIQEGTAPRSPSQMSLISNSSVNTAMTWQSKPGFGLQQARAITFQNAQGPFEDEDLESVMEKRRKKERVEQVVELEDELETSHVQAGANPDSMTNAADQPTPPLSPSSVDFYMRSAHSSIDAPTSHNRIMAVTRQEEMLLAALRHKRQVMRETILHEIEDNARGVNPVSKGHHSKSSEATITESNFDLDFPSPPKLDLDFPTPPNFDLDFPAPPMCKDRTAVAANGKTVIDLRRASSQGQLRATNVSKSLPPVGPALPSSKKALLKAQQEISRTNQQERILLYLDHPHKGEKGIIEEAEPSPDLSDFMAFETEEAEDAGDVVPDAILYSSQSSHSSGRSGRRGTSKRRSDATNRKVSEQSPDRAAELGVPRPDSPISSDSLSAMQRRGTVNKKTARLSAVGPARWGYED
ncbi:hypothetical protein QQZ08_007505 [Neonectria magnoliae]|uniref:Uncharacterized protein n=1 Tax=Neonectria magnoliae TaxID=2732573 RepID=A0ABR1HY00_9HYPO